MRVRWDNAKVPTKLVRYYTQDQSALSDPDGEEDETSVSAANKWWSELSDPWKWGPLLRRTFESHKFGRKDRYELVQAALAFSGPVIGGRPEIQDKVSAEIYFILRDIKSGFGYSKTHYKVRMFLVGHEIKEGCTSSSKLYKMLVKAQSIPFDSTKSLCDAFPNKFENPNNVLGQQSVRTWCRSSRGTREPGWGDDKQWITEPTFD